MSGHEYRSQPIPDHCRHELTSGEVINGCTFKHDVMQKGTFNNLPFGNAQPTVASNAWMRKFAKERNAPDSCTAEGRTAYSDLLGRWLGPQVYAGVCKNFTFAEVAGLVEGEVIGIIHDVFDEAADRDYHDNSYERKMELLAKRIGRAIETGLEGRISALIQHHDPIGMRGSTQDFVDSPKAVVAVALLAAAVAVATDQDIPGLSKTFDFGEKLAIKVAASMGTLQNFQPGEELKAGFIFEDGDTRFQGYFEANKNEHGGYDNGGLEFGIEVATTFEAIGRYLGLGPDGPAPPSLFTQ